MHRILYVFLPNWAIDRLRRTGQLPNAGGPPGKETASEPPFATVISENGRQSLAAVNPAAAAKGLAAGLPLADALSFLPGLATRPAEPAADGEALRRLAEWCGRYSPWTAPDFDQNNGADGVKIDITGSAHLWGGEASLVADLSRRLARQGLAHRLAIADTLGAAWGLARCKSAAKAAEAAVIVAPGATREALVPLPVAALRLDPALVEGLHRVGLRRVGEVMAMPRDALARRFGEAIGRRLDQALGDLPEPLSPMGEVPTRRVRLSFAEPIADPADLARAIERLTQDLVVRLAREGTGARRLDLGFHRVDGRVERIRIGTARPSRDPAHLAGLLRGKLDAVDPGFGIEDAILAAFAIEALAPEQLEAPLGRTTNAHLRPGAAAGDDNRRHTPSPSDGGGFGWGCGRSEWGSDLAPLFDRIGARLGLDAVARLEARASHIPERASVAVPIGDAAASINFPRPAKPPRPVRLFAPPEPVEAFWVLPDDPPFRFTWRRRPHRVAQADGPERIAEEWWRPNGQITGGRLVGGAGDPNAVRDYYRVEDETGRRFWLFRAGLPGDPPPRWFVHGVFA